MDSCLAPSFLPATAVLEMTYKCNHQCLFCSCPWEAPESKFTKHREQSLSEWKDIVKKLTTMGISSFAFSGGEPLLYKGIEELIEFTSTLKTELIETEGDVLVTKEITPKLYLISNGKLVNDKVLDLCQKTGSHLSMSLPGLTTFKYHTQSGNPEHILHWFRKAKEKGISTTVNITVTSKNIFELYETISEALIAGADTLLMNRFLPGGRGIKYAKELMLSVDQINEMLDIAEEVLLKANRTGSVGTELPKCIIKSDHYKQLSVGTACSAGLDFFVVDPSGYIRACNHSPVRLDHFNDIEKVKTNSYWRTFTLKDYHPGMCKTCDKLYLCDGGCREAAHIYSGSVTSPDPVFV